jgi:hypothetical protein
MRAFTAAVLAAGLSGLSIAGCSSSGSSTSGGTTGSSTSGGTTGTGTTGGTSGGSSGGTSGTTTGSSTGGEPYTGFVIFSEQVIGGTKDYNGSAGFYTTFSFAGCPGGTEQGGCCYESAAAAADAGAGAPPDDVNAGTLTLQDGTTTLATLPFMTGMGYTSVNSVTTSALTWTAGAMLGVNATGDASGVASFSGTVVAPARLSGVSPAVMTLTSIARGSDFVLSWTAAGSSTVLFILLAANGTSPDGLIRCTASSGDGSLTVPAALLGNFQSGDHALVLLTVENNTIITASNATVGLTAEAQVQGGVTIH